MRWIGCIILGLMVLQSCEWFESEVRFRLTLDDFTLTVDPDFPLPDQIEFRHTYSSGLISFSKGQESYTFQVGQGKLEDYLFELPPGEYTLEMEIPPASLYGQASCSFHVTPRTVNITELTETLTIQADANCSLILISDEQDQLQEGPYIIERHSIGGGYFSSYPLARDTISGLYYSYFTPDPVEADPSAFLWFYGDTPGEEKGGMPTSRFRVGHQYYISILE